MFSEGGIDASSYLTFTKNPFLTTVATRLIKLASSTAVFVACDRSGSFLPSNNTRQKLRTYVRAKLFVSCIEKDGFTRLEKISCKNSVALYRPSCILPEKMASCSNLPEREQALSDSHSSTIATCSLSNIVI